MELKLHTSMATVGSISRAANSVVFTHSSTSISICTYSIPDSSRRRNGNNTSRSTYKIPPLRKGNHPVEPKLKLDHQNQNASLPLNVDLVALCEEGKHDRVMELMGQGVTADYRVYFALLNLCEHTRSLELGKKIHEFLRRSTFRGDVELSNRLIGMYSKCGSVKDARRVFDQMQERNTASWHLMIGGYTANGLACDGLLAFQKMKHAGVPLDGETFELVLAACAQAEAVEEGLLHLESMKENGIVPRVEHYLEVINIMGNAGRLNEAEEFIEKIPIEVGAEGWESLRNFARIHGNLDLEDRAEELLKYLDPSKTIADKLPMPPRKKQHDINMLEEKNRLCFTSLSIIPKQGRRRAASSLPESSESDVRAKIAPLQLESPIGQFLSQILVDHPPWTSSLSSSKQTAMLINKRKSLLLQARILILYRRIVEVKANERRKALEEILYALVVQKFIDANISLTPSVTPDLSGKIDLWPDEDGDITSIAEISKFRVEQVYAAAREDNESSSK
ncbi:hypothetical protein V8G54_012105 [Vigna mungo]|uniref:Pentatricopeptide repeat-containing protein n=1 Tax=Vigna mungo TaxID=3915 RepID=A0AAQ3S3P7_VIGMU